MEPVFPQPGEFFKPDDKFCSFIPAAEEKQNQMQRLFI